MFKCLLMHTCRAASLTPLVKLAHLEVQVRHDVLDFFPGVVSVLHAGMRFGNGEQQGRVKTP